MAAESQGSAFFQEAAAMTAEYGGTFVSLLSQFVASLGSYGGAAGAMVWVYLLQLSGVFSDPCVIIVIGFAILIYTVVSGLSFASRKAYNHFRPPQQQQQQPEQQQQPGQPAVPEPDTQRSEGPGAQESDFETPAGGMANPCYCPQNPGGGGGQGDPFEQFDLEATPQEGVVAKMIRWANIAFAGQMMDSACIPHCMGYMQGAPCQPPSSHSQKDGGPGAAAELADNYYNQKNASNSKQPPQRDESPQRPCYGDDRDRRDHAHRHKHRHSHGGAPRGSEVNQPPNQPRYPPESPAASPASPQQQGAVAVAAAPPNKRGSGWFGSWFQPAPGGPPQPPPQMPPEAGQGQGADDPLCSKPKCPCACKRKHSRDAHALRQGYPGGHRSSHSRQPPGGVPRRQPPPPAASQESHSTHRGHALSPRGGRTITRIHRRTEHRYSSTGAVGGGGGGAGVQTQSPHEERKRTTLTHPPTATVPARHR